MEASLNLPTGYGSYVGLSLNEPINTCGAELHGVELNTQTPVLYKSKDRLEGIRCSCKYRNYTMDLTLQLFDDPQFTFFCDSPI